MVRERDDASTQKTVKAGPTDINQYSDLTPVDRPHPAPTRARTIFDVDIAQPSGKHAASTRHHAARL
jgi:hypothetical protein